MTSATVPARRLGDRALLGRLLRDARPYWRHAVGLFLLWTAATPVALLTPLPLKLVADNVLGTQPLPEPFASLLGDPAGAPERLLFVAVALTIGVIAFNAAITLAAELLMLYASERLTLDLRARLFRHAQRLSFGYHEREGTTDSVYRIQYDAEVLGWTGVAGLTPLLTSGLVAAAMMYVTARIDLDLALVMLATAPALVVITIVARRLVRSRWDGVKQRQRTAMGILEEVLGALRVVRAFGMERVEAARFEAAAVAGRRAAVEVTAYQGFAVLVASLAVAVGSALVLYIGAEHVRSGRITLGDLILVLGYAGGIAAPLQRITHQVIGLQAAFSSADRVYSVLDLAHDVEEARVPRRIRRAKGAIDFEQVSFAYPGGRSILSAVDVSVPAGAHVGITGESGSGKTTLLSLIVRFVDPTSGRILLDGGDLRQARLDDLRRQFAIVDQHPLLFARTIAENIAYARPGATEREIETAARAAGAHDFIGRMTAGYETVVGERGAMLSGGERQRISLARAFLRDAPVLLLDEPTSAVDAMAEASILEGIAMLASGRTTFMVTHRLSTLAASDLRLVVRDGHVSRVDPRADDPLPYTARAGLGAEPIHRHGRTAVASAPQGTLP